MNERKAHLGLIAAVAGVAVGLTGCVGGPRLVPEEKRVVIDRAVIERPTRLDVVSVVPGLTGPSAIAFDSSPGATDGAMIVAEGFSPDRSPRIFALLENGRRIDIYPNRTGPFGLFNRQEKIFGPVGGLLVHQGEIFVAHRDASGMGVISAFTYQGERRTVVAELPARGDHAISDLEIHPTNGRLYFGVGSATNSGVVGMDNFQRGWASEHRDFADVPATDIRLLGYRFDTPNPERRLFSGNDLSVTAPFQPFATSTRLRIDESKTGKPTAALFSISPGGGDLRVEAHGLRRATGLAFNSFGNLFITNQGAELRGTRPIKDDPDVVLRVPLGGGTWYGWPDFSADLAPLTEPRFQPPRELLARGGYPEISFLIDHEASGLVRPDRSTLLRGVLPSLSGAMKMDLIEDQPGFEQFRGQLVIALAGDRSPFATSGIELIEPVGFKLVSIDPDTRQVIDFVYNTQMKPAHLLEKNSHALYRPVEAQFGPDGALYIVDAGKIDYTTGKPRVTPRTGRILKVAPPVEHMPAR